VSLSILTLKTLRTVGGDSFGASLSREAVAGRKPETMKQTREQIEASLRLVSIERDVASIALEASLSNRLAHIGRGNGWTLRLAQPLGAHGGIAVVTYGPPNQYPCTRAEYFEGWKRGVDEAATHSPTDENLYLRHLAELAAAYIRDAQRLVGSGMARNVCGFPMAASGKRSFALTDASLTRNAALVVA